MSGRAGPPAPAAGGGASNSNNTANTNAPETLAQAIERVWGRTQRWPGRAEQQREARNKANWASVWVLVTDVAQPVQTRGTDSIVRITVTDESLAAATERAKAAVADARARGGDPNRAAAAQHPLAHVHWPGGIQLSVFATPCAVQRLMRTLGCGVDPSTSSFLTGGVAPPEGAILRLTNVVVQGWDERPQLFAKLGADVAGPHETHASSRFGIASYPRRDPRDGGAGCSDLARPAAVTSSSLAVPRDDDGAQGGRLAALRLLAARRDAELGDPDAAMVHYYGASSVPMSLDMGGGGYGGYGGGGFGGGGFGGGGGGAMMPPPAPPPAPVAVPATAAPPTTTAAAMPPGDATMATAAGVCDPGVFGSGGGGGGGWAAAQQQRVTRRQAAGAGGAEGGGAAAAGGAGAAGAAAPAPPPPPPPQGVAHGIAAAVTGVIARAFGGGATPAAGPPPAASPAPAPAPAPAHQPPPPPPPPPASSSRPPPPPGMAPALSALRLPEADHEAPGLVDVRARVLALDTTSRSGVVVCWLWDGTDVAPLPEHATCPPAIHQGEPIREPAREAAEAEAAAAASAGGGTAATTPTTTAPTNGPISRPLPLRSAPGVQVLGAQTVLAAGQGGSDAAVERAPLLSSPSPPSSSSAAAVALASASAAAAAARMLTCPKLPPVGSAVPLIILPVMRGSRVHGGGGGHGQQQQQATPRLDAQSLPAPGAWVKLRHLALQVAPGGELQLLYGTPSKMSLVPAPGSAGDGAAPHLELRLAERLAAGETAPWARASRGGRVVASLSAEEVGKAVERAREIGAAVREHGDVEEEEGEEGGEGAVAAADDGENAPPPPPSQRQQRLQPKKADSTTTTTTTTNPNAAPPPSTTTITTIPLVTLRQLLSSRERARCRRDALALARRDVAEGYSPRAAYFTRALRAVVRVASLRPADLVEWAHQVPGGGGQQQWALCGRAALADGTVVTAASSSPSPSPSPSPSSSPSSSTSTVVAFVAPETSEALLGVDAGPLDGRDARARDRLAKLAASVARLQAVGPAPKEERGGGGGAGAAASAAADADADDDDLSLLAEPTAWVEALIVPRVRLPAGEEEDDDGQEEDVVEDDDGSGWQIDYLLTGARLLSEEEEAKRRQRLGGGGGAAEAAASATAALAAAVRDAVAAAQLEAARRRAGSSPVAAARRPLPPTAAAAEVEGEGRPGTGKRRRRG